jgi:ABC-type molybdate transport system permease subunit
MSTIISILWFLFIAYVVIDLWKKNIDSTKKILWTALLIFVPVVGLILCFILERPSFLK